jgi:hypothetical protein
MTRRKNKMKFKNGDKIIKKNYKDYSYASKWNSFFIVLSVNKDTYTLKQTNLICDEKIDFIDDNFDFLKNIIQ